MLEITVVFGALRCRAGTEWCQPHDEWYKLGSDQLRNIAGCHANGASSGVRGPSWLLTALRGAKPPGDTAAHGTWKFYFNVVFSFLTDGWSMIGQWIA